MRKAVKIVFFLILGVECRREYDWDPKHFTLPPPVSCTHSRTGGDIAAISTALAPRAVINYFKSRANRSVHLSDLMNNLTSFDIPLAASFGVGTYNISIVSSSFLFDHASAIQLVQQHNTLLDTMCKALRDCLICERIVPYDLWCGCRSGENFITAGGATLCVTHPCSSQDIHRGWCTVDVDPLLNSCIHSNGLDGRSINYSVVIPMASIEPKYTKLLAQPVELPLHFWRFCLSCALLLSPLDVLLRAAVVFKSVCYMISSLQTGGSFLSIFEFLPAINGILYKIWLGEVSLEILFFTGTAFVIAALRLIGMLALYFWYQDSPSCASALLLFGLVVYIIQRPQSSPVPLMSREALYGNKEIIKSNTEKALAKLRRDLGEQPALFEVVSTKLQMNGKHKVAHLIKCFRDGSFSGLPYIPVNKSSQQLIRSPFLLLLASISVTVFIAILFDAGSIHKLFGIDV